MTRWTICYQCEKPVPVDNLIPHWGKCAEERAIARRLNDFVTTVAMPPSELEAKVWEQIDDILVATGFVS